MSTAILPGEVQQQFATIPDGCSIRVGDASEILRDLRSESFRACVTSPPYWGMRDYGVPGQVGAETELSEYIGKMRTIFAEVRRVLTPDGTLWLNLGDCYTSGNRTWRARDRKNPARAMRYRPPTPEGLKPKDLVGVPWRVALALQEDGWFLRSDIIWHKPNCQPESVKDRPTRAHEYLFLFSRSVKYHYDHGAVMEPGLSNGGLRNRRTVWSIKTRPAQGAHFSTFPPELIRPCVLAATEPCDPVLDPFFGSGTVGQVCLELDRKFLGVELKQEYAALAMRRLGWAPGP